MPRKQKKNTWYPLDNAGVLYSAIQKERYSAVYRFSALMTKAVDPQALQRAVQKTMPRFPGFGVRIRRGAFWCYFEPNPNPGPFVKPDMANPCQPLRFHEDNDWLIRILYYEKRISVEVFHAISDGAGTLVFLRTLLAVYLRELGFSIPNGPGILDVTAPPRKEELEDAYARYAGSRTLRGKLEKTAFPNTSAPEPFYTLNVTLGLVPVDRLREDLWKNHPQIQIVDFDFYNTEAFNQCENNNCVLMAMDYWRYVHPLMKILPVEWDYTIPFGLFHAPAPSPGVERFLKAVEKVVRS